MTWFKREPKKIVTPEDQILRIEFDVTLPNDYTWHLSITGYQHAPVAPGTVEMANAMLAGLHEAGYDAEVEITSGTWEKKML